MRYIEISEGIDEEGITFQQLWIDRPTFPGKYLLVKMKKNNLAIGIATVTKVGRFLGDYQLRPEYRKKGYARFFMDFLINKSELSPQRLWADPFGQDGPKLSREDLIAFYGQWGFRKTDFPEDRFMTQKSHSKEAVFMERMTNLVEDNKKPAILR